ncbi:hypothetical protein SLEP1_g55541 [Rubroshorea leprosula]|uniref:Uncharacterized protein n=1 Tax=Rubroshorea leprosula TaxID=152421 RepID=A0AAV5MJI0_9ROSI|nr:hypothetical protein SLEP1_g55541 [Rubroshorea leprosula]
MLKRNRAGEVTVGRQSHRRPTAFPIPAVGDSTTTSPISALRRSPLSSINRTDLPLLHQSSSSPPVTVLSSASHRAFLRQSSSSPPVSSSPLTSLKKLFTFFKSTG